VIWLAGLITAGLTAFYMFRLIFLTFYGQERFPEEARHHLHESPPSMTVPLIALAVLSAVGGFVGLPSWMNLGPNRFEEFLEPSLELARRPEHAALPQGVEAGFALVSVLVALIGIYVAYRFYVAKPSAAGDLARRLAGVYRLLKNKYYVDEAYDVVVVRPVAAASKDILWQGVDVGIIDGAVNGTADTIRGSAGLLKHLQNGLIRSYAAWILAGAVALLLYITLLR